MEVVPGAEKDCTCIRYIKGLSQKIQSIGHAPWTRFPKSPTRLVHLPRTPVLQPPGHPLVDLGFKDIVSCGRSEAMTVDVMPKVEASNCSSSISLPWNSDDESGGSTVDPGSEQFRPRCLDTANLEEILISLRAHGILRSDPDPQVLPKEVYRPYAPNVPPGFEPHRPSLTRTNHHLRWVPSVRPVRHLSTCTTVPPGYEQSDTVSSCSDTTDSDTTLEQTELVRDTLLQERKAVSAPSLDEAQQILDQLMLTRFRKVLNNSSESSDSHEKCHLIRADGTSDLVKVSYRAALASDHEVNARHVDSNRDTDATTGSSDSSDSENVCKAEGGDAVVQVSTVVQAASTGASSNEVCSDRGSDVEQSSISRWDSALDSARNSSSDSTDFDVLSDPAKQSSKCEEKEGSTDPSNPSTGPQADILVAEEPKTVVSGCEASKDTNQAPHSLAVASQGFKLNPNAKEFVPRASMSGNLHGQCGPDSDRPQKVKWFGVDVTLPSAEAKAYAPFSVPGPSLGAPFRLNLDSNAGWVRWGQAKEYIPQLANTKVIWGLGRGNGSTCTDKSGPVQDLKVPGKVPILKNKSATYTVGPGFERAFEKKNKRQPGYRPEYVSRPMPGPVYNQRLPQSLASPRPVKSAPGKFSRQP